MATYSIKANKGENVLQKSVSKAEVIILNDMITKVTSHHLSHILFLEGSYRCCPHTQGGKCTQGHEHWDEEVTESHLRI